MLEQDQDNVERRSYIKPSTKIYVSHRHTKPLGTHRTLYIFILNITNLFIYLFIIIWALSLNKWLSRDVTKIQTTKLSILLRFYFQFMVY